MAEPSVSRLTAATARGQSCPCGSGKLFDVCCEPVHTGARVPATAEELMRARFTAHAVGDYRFLHFSYAGTASKPYVEEADDGEPAMRWTKLVINAHEPDVRPDVSTVDFSAFYEEESQQGVLHEKSEFHRTAGKWIYVRSLREGPAPVVAKVKAGRNDPCPCGSDKKFKHCCL